MAHREGHNPNSTCMSSWVQTKGSSLKEGMWNLESITQKGMNLTWGSRLEREGVAFHLTKG